MKHAPGQHEIDFNYEPALACGRQYYDLQAGSEDRLRNATACMLPLCRSLSSGVQWFRYAYQYVTAQRRQKYFCMMKRTDIGLSQDAYYFIGGLMKHVYSMTAIDKSAGKFLQTTGVRI